LLSAVIEQLQPPRNPTFESSYGGLTPLALFQSGAKRAEVLKELETGTPDIVAGLTKGKDAVAAFVSVDHNADFSQFTVKANSSKYSESDGMWANVLLMAGTNLQAFRGVPADSNRVTVRIVDVDSGKTLLSVDSTSLK